MTLALLGTGTSQGVPVVGCTCRVCRSDDPRDKRLRTSALLRDSATGAAVLIDCGPDARAQMLSVGLMDLDAVLITHEHNDHIIGLDDLRPFVFKRAAPFRIYAEPRVQASIRERFAYAFAKTPYPGAPRFELVDVAPGERLRIGSLPEVEILRVTHGRLPIVGVRVGDVAYLTDVKTVPPETLARLTGLTHFVVSALHRREHHSHLRLDEAVALAERVGARETTFIHMSHLMGAHAEVEAELPAGMRLGYDGLTLAVGS